MHPRTRDHLWSAIHTEAIAAVQYELDAEQARRHGKAVLAQCFDRLAAAKRDHLEGLVTLGKLLGSGAENLRRALDDERFEAETVYQDRARSAAGYGDGEVAERFLQIAAEERRYREVLLSALRQLEEGAAGAPTVGEAMIARGAVPAR